MFADNRGVVTLDFSRGIKAKTLSKKNIGIYTAGADGRFGTKDDSRLRTRIIYDSHLHELTLITRRRPNTPYRVFLNSPGIVGTDGVKLDGQFNGSSHFTGRGTPGSVFDVVTRVTTGSPVARFYTTAGDMDVRLFRSTVTATVNNFMLYANFGAYDSGFIHRETTIADDGIAVIQGGGYNITSSDTITKVNTTAPVPIEAGIKNARGTLAEARQTNSNTGTSEWFFNVQSNPSLNKSTNSPGYSVFGKIINKGGLAVMDALARHQIIDASGDTNIGSDISSALTQLPVNNATTVQLRGDHVKPSADLIRITRIAIGMDITATPKPGVKPRH